MRRVLAATMIVLILCGCSSTSNGLNRALKLRESMLQAEKCTFSATITADYGEKVYDFKLDCSVDSQGNVNFVVTEPQTISGISGCLTEDKGELTFDDQVLLFETLADGQISPVSAPWLLIHTLRSGYIRGCENSSDGIHVQIDDSYKEDALLVDVWTDKFDMPIRGEIYWQGKRVVTIDVENFTIV